MQDCKVLEHHLIGGALGGDEEAGPLELGLEAQTPSRSERRPQGLMGNAHGRAELIKEDEVGALERVPMADDKFRVGQPKKKRWRLEGGSVGRTLPKG